MDPHLLRTFVTVVRTGSFSAAADELGYTQAAVSQQIASLENDLKVRLLHRRPVRTTEAGARLLDHAGPILLRLQAARSEITRLSAAPRTRLRVGASPLAAVHVADALAEARRTHPRLDAAVRVLPRAGIDAAVATGDLDIGLVDGIAAPSDPLRLDADVPVTAVAVAERPLVAALPAAHPLASRTGLDLHDLVDALWLDAPDAAVPLPSLRRATGTRDGFRASLACAGGDVALVAALVAAGHGLALLPAGLAEHPGLAEVPVRAPRIVHRTELLHPRTADPAGTAFVAALTGGNA
ncbi:LysR family transcriptional regulator [Actinomadura latina]|uniref:LysR family transcriptional regulator n=1 Tax=Actinomadura latina TaxID=163603 RepID=A0A846YYP4_9ACTN|nr:LysR family transcriptional regulator [Actinomadura latina]NKZ06100.1 LysR family transcriptional regulator [Actinomadura latina]